MPKHWRIALDIVLIFVPLAVVSYFLAFPDKFDAFLDWLMRVL